jgi:hypothetical protein
MLSREGCGPNPSMPHRVGNDPELSLALVDDGQFRLLDDVARHGAGDRALVGSRREVERLVQRAQPQAEPHRATDGAQRTIVADIADRVPAMADLSRLIGIGLA